MIHRQCSFSNLRRIRLSIWNSRSTSVVYKNFLKGGFIHRDTNKVGIVVKIQAMATSHYFIVCQITLLGISDHFVKEYYDLSPWIYIYLKSYRLDFISYTGSERVMAYKYLLSAAQSVTALLVFRSKGEGGKGGGEYTSNEGKGSLLW